MRALLFSKLGIYLPNIWKNINLTLILVAVIYIGGQIFDGLFINDNVANLTHILGGVVGSIAGYVMNKEKVA